MDTSKADVSRLYKPQFSFFGCGYVNKQGMAVPQVKPFYDARLPYEIYRYIKGGKAREATLELRQITDEKEARRFKVLNFRAFTPAGVFKYRNVHSLFLYNQLIVIDIDNISSQKRLHDIRQLLLNDPYFETELLFVSPSGNGLKWIVYLGDVRPEEHGHYFRIIADYLRINYGIIADESGKDICRLCFLPYDPDCYINPDLNLRDFKGC